METKTCLRCQKKKPIDKFRHPSKAYPEYRAARCRDCERELDRERYHKYVKNPRIKRKMQRRNEQFRKENRERIRVYAREYMRALRRARVELGEAPR